ncbi:hypothetical protein HD806DRAFT_533961 [Xylariaceae sp. AK1471]|nr:hypothetical protein HD806DRAFT_533961 [Xylariaceae sp. AK1471]
MALRWGGQAPTSPAVTVAVTVAVACTARYGLQMGCKAAVEVWQTNLELRNTVDLEPTKWIDTFR